MMELHYQYAPFAPERAGGRIHQIQVRSTRPGITVRARRTTGPRAADVRLFLNLLGYLP
jgi:hypothetical protein